MPTLTAKRKVAYTKADLNALDAACVVLEFMREFDDEIQAGISWTGLQEAMKHIEKRRAEASKPKRTTGTVAPK